MGTVTKESLHTTNQAIKDAELAVDEARRARTAAVRSEWEDTDWSVVTSKDGGKLTAKAKESVVADETADERQALHEAEAELAFQTRQYEIDYIAYQNGE